MLLSARDLNATLWAAADDMRKQMNADVYKDYLLGLVFYKALSDKMLVEAYDLIHGCKPASLDDAQKAYEEVQSDAETWGDLQAELTDRFGCAIQPDKTFSAFYKQINERTFMLDNLSQAFRDIESASGGVYAGLFDDFDIHSKDLGTTPYKRNALLSDVISKLADIDFNLYQEDALGDAYEYLISQFASESGKKAGEFYTPQAVSHLIARIVTFGQDQKFGFSVYDPACGSGSLLLQIRNYLSNAGNQGNIDIKSTVEFFGQELKNQTYNLARMNMMLHRVPGNHQHLRNGDTLDADWPTDEPTNFDAVVMNPPYSQKYSAAAGLLTDPRFAPFKKLPPASKADFAFLLHGYYHLKESGTMGIVLPHGVLFRGAAEGTIREELLKKGAIYAVIGLPAGIFFSTGIPTCVIILKKDNPDRSVLFIDASKEFRKERAKNFLDQEHIDKIFNTYIERKDVDKYAHLATMEEIESNGYNLNIPRYVDSSEPEEEIDLNATFAELKKLEQEEKEVDAKLAVFFKELGLNFDEVR